MKHIEVRAARTQTAVLDHQCDIVDTYDTIGEAKRRAKYILSGKGDAMSKLALCPECGKLIALAFPVHDCTPHKHGFEIRFAKGRSLKVLSYAIYRHGFAVVDHETTRANRKAGSDLAAHLKIERARNPDLKVLKRAKLEGGDK